MQRRRQRAGAESSLAAVASEYSRIEAFLQAQLVLHADALREAHELGATGQENVLSVINLDAVDLKRSGAASQEAAALEELDVFSRFLEIERRGKAGEPAADDGHGRPSVAGAQDGRETTDRYALDSHERTTT